LIEKSVAMLDQNVNYPTLVKLACLAAAPAVNAVSAAIATSVTMARVPQRRIATVDCAVVNRLTMLSPIEMCLGACVDQVSDPDFEILTTTTIHSNSHLGLFERSGGESLITTACIGRRMARG
jgi:hypothetical protein